MNTPSTSHTTSPRRRLIGTGVPLAAVFFALVAAGSLLPQVALADAFAPRQTSELVERLNTLEAQLEMLRERQAQMEQASGSNSSGDGFEGPDGLWLPPPPEPALSPEEFEPTRGYTLLAEINGRFLVRDGDTRRMLSADEFERFKAVRAAQAAERDALAAERDAQAAERDARSQLEHDAATLAEAGASVGASPPPAPPPASGARPVTRLR